MKKPDDCSLTPEQLKVIRKHADRLLREAGANGRFPTPVDELVDAAKLSVERVVSLDNNFLLRMYHRVTDPIKHAVDKILGLFDSRDRTIYLDHTAHPSKKVFLKIHETGHGYLPHQRKMFAFIEESNAPIGRICRQSWASLSGRASSARTGR